MKHIDLSEIEFIINQLEKQNFDDCIFASLHSSYKEVAFHKGFQACISCIKDYFNIKKDIDIYHQMRYL